MLVLVLVLVALMGACQTTKIVVGSSIVVEWDAPVLGMIPPSEVSYEVGFQPYPSGAFILVATITTFEQTITFTTEGAYKIGVRTVRTVATDGAILTSAWTWSDVDGVPTPWYVVYYATPGSVIRIRIK